MCAGGRIPSVENYFQKFRFGVDFSFFPSPGAARNVTRPLHSCEAQGDLSELLVQTFARSHFFAFLLFLVIANDVSASDIARGKLVTYIRRYSSSGAPSLC